jgi:predicted metal-dependent hydrolase
MSLPTENLRAQIAGFEEKARGWLKSQSKDVDNLARQHEATIQENNGPLRIKLIGVFNPCCYRPRLTRPTLTNALSVVEIANLKQECQALKDEEERQKELETELEAELAKLNQEYKDLLATKASKPAERAALKEKITELDNINKQKVRCVVLGCLFFFVFPRPCRSTLL